MKWTAMLAATVLIEVAGIGSVFFLKPSLGVGAVEEAQPDAPLPPKKAQPQFKPKADPGPATEPAPAPKKKSEAPARADDERIKKAQVEKEALENSERALLKATSLNLGESLAKLQKSIDAMKPADLEAEQKAIQQLQAVVIELRGLAREILGKQPEYKRLLGVYQSELKNAPGAFLPAADVFDQMSEEEQLPEFKTRYKGLAKSLRQLAKVMEKRASDLADEEKEVAEAFRYVAAAEKYLTGLSEWLGTYPSFQAGVERQKQIAELRAFIRHFRDLDAAFQKFNTKVTQTRTVES